MRAPPIKTWSLMKQALRNRFGVGNHEGQRKGQTEEKFMESSTGEKSTKVDEPSQAQDLLDRKVIHQEKDTCNLVKEEYSYTMNSLSPQQLYEEKRKIEEKERVENAIRKKSISEDKRIEEQDVIEEKSREEKVKSVVSTKESEGKRKESECLIENHEFKRRTSGRKAR
ncbi:hypothetical protein M9H77_22798 [Catharanthus roseus]|uniref:Uncharacterized protein n=1 Tax=Catharanthus roseus TaxID=4058 RepID=A0ACC0ARG6_CATRO|nr:hypothetical protein M9H77_22798 [Catharanthus roseus]